METDIHLSLLPTQCILKKTIKTIQMSKTLLIALKCDQFNWQVIGDFRMVAFLVGLQGGFTIFPCYLCLWDSRDTIANCHRRIWPKQTEYSIGYSNIKWDPLIDSTKILLPPLHINLGLIKQFRWPKRYGASVS